MCVVGLYFVFLLFQDLILGYYTSTFGNATIPDQGLDSVSSGLDMQALYNTTSLDLQAMYNKTGFDLQAVYNSTGFDLQAVYNSTGLDMQVVYNIFGIDAPSLPPKHIVKRSIEKQLKRNISTTTKPKVKQQQSKGVTPKQHEFINTLLKKTNNEVNKNHTYKTTERNVNATKIILGTKLHKVNPMAISTPAQSSHTTTPSNIEFYYLEDTSVIDKERVTKQSKDDKGTSDVPFLIFHLKGPYDYRLPILSKNHSISDSRFRNDNVKISAIRLNEVHNDIKKLTVKPTHFSIEGKSTAIDKTTRPLYQRSRKEYFFDYNAPFKPTIKSSITSRKVINAASTYRSTNKSTTLYDKIKFFEIYDQYTQTLNTKMVTTVKIDIDEKNLVDKNEKTLLEHIDKGQSSHDHVQAKHSKKHITDSVRHTNQEIDEPMKLKSFRAKNETQKRQNNQTSYFMDASKKPEPNQTFSSYTRQIARLSEYPFAAVYIYEPSQVHCDAAAINAHWLVASGSCLSRVSKKPYESFEAYGEGRSAFVAYCGEQWWEPERVAYVKYTVVHPLFHPTDKKRQHLYNIGAIQVVNSLISACAGWAPVSLMSYKVAAKPSGSWASAVGWGLDRFDTKYGATDLPKTPLMVYKSLVYFDSCPGNLAYSKAKEMDEGGGVKNVHCLSLPPYNGEATDPVHGSILLADGKLIALYLQEERRRWGEQSAQYTGVWRLIPWLTDVARDPDDLDVFIEI